MPKVRTYRITLHPAKILVPGGPGESQFAGYSTQFSLGSGVLPPRTTVEASTLDELRAKVQAFADESGIPVYEAEREGTLTWAAFVQIADGGRKPAGFDKAFAGMSHLFTPAAVAA